MPEPEVLLLGVGMMTAVGLSAAETAASARAGTMRFTASDWLDRYHQPITVAEVPRDGLPGLAEAVAGIPGLTARGARMLALGTMPLKECLQPLAARRIPVGLMLALAEREGQRPFDAVEFLKLFAQQTDNAFDLGRSTALFKGRAGGLLAVGQACRRIREGKERFIVAGGIDTCLDLYVLAMLDREQRLKSARHLDGLVPGEGAAFLLLAQPDAARAAGLPALSVVFAVAEGLEEGHFYSDKPYRGDGLAAALTKFMTESGLKEPISEVYASMNGESYWGKEWGVAFMRNRAAFADEYGMHHPADCFGETGAACGPLLLGLAALGMKQGYRRSPCLVYASSDDGQRAVLATALPERS